MTSIIKVDQIQTAAGGVPTAADLGLNVSGTVLQTLQATNGTVYSVGSGSGNLTGLSITITPTSSTSKFLLTANIGHYSYIAGGGATYIFTFRRNSTDLAFVNSGTLKGFAGGVWNDGNVSPSTGFMQYLDSPNTTSSITYHVGYTIDGTMTIGKRGNDTYLGTSQGFVVQEIAG